MRIVVFSDIHGNALALEAMLEDLRGEPVDRMVCLGDAIQGGPQPAEVVSRLRELECPVVMGNADEWLLSGFDSGAETFTESMKQVRDWQRSQLSAADLEFIRGFAPTVELPLEDGGALLCYHGSPKSFDDWIVPATPEEQVRAFLEPDERIIYTGGHAHLQFLRHVGRTFHFNPGSVGFAKRHDQTDEDFRYDVWAEYAILTDSRTRLSLEFRRVGYDLQLLIYDYLTSGRPHAQEVARQYGMV